MRDEERGERSRTSTTTRITRRRLAALAVPVALAGCFEEPDPAAEAGDPGANGDPDAGEDDPADDGVDGDDEDDDDGDVDDDDDGGNGDDGDDADDGEPTPDRVDPGDAGVIVTDASVTNVSERGSRTTITASLEVENTGRFEYGTLEFRVDAYKTRPNDPDREPVGFEYVRTNFGPGDRFTGGTETITVDIQIRTRDGAMLADPDWYAVDAAVRLAEPIND